MNDSRDVQRAWRFIEGFHVPQLTAEERGMWTNIIERLTVDEFQRGCRKSRERPVEHVHLRPSPEAFRAYAKGQSPPRIPVFPPKEDGPLTDADRAAMSEVLDRWRNRKASA